MRKYFIASFFTLFAIGIVSAQNADSTTAIKDTDKVSTTGNIKIKKKNQFANIDLSHRGGDHFIFQYGVLGWSGAEGIYATKGFSREFNAAFMLDKPFKGNPHYSLGIGVGYSSSSAFFNKKYVDIAAVASTLPFSTTVPNTTNTFKKYKVALSYVEIPIELRYSANAENPSKGFRMALGIKGSLLMNAHTKGKDLLDQDGSSIKGSTYILKEYSKRFFNSSRITGTMRVSMGMFSLYGTYQLTQLLKTGTGPSIHPYSIGLGIGLM